MSVATRPLNELLAGKTLGLEELEELIEVEEIEISDQLVLGCNAFSTDF